MSTGTTRQQGSGNAQGGPFHATAEDLARALGVSPSWVSRYRRERWFPGTGSRGFDELAVRDAAARNVRGWIDRAYREVAAVEEDPIAVLACSPDPDDRKIAAQLLATLSLVAIAWPNRLRDFFSEDAKGWTEEARHELDLEAWFASDSFLELSRAERTSAVVAWRTGALATWRRPEAKGPEPLPRPDLWSRPRTTTTRRAKQ